MKQEDIYKSHYSSLISFKSFNDLQQSMETRTNTLRKIYGHGSWDEQIEMITLHHAFTPFKNSLQGIFIMDYLPLFLLLTLEQNPKFFIIHMNKSKHPASFLLKQAKIGTNNCIFSEVNNNHTLIVKCSHTKINIDQFLTVIPQIQDFYFMLKDFRNTSKTLYENLEKKCRKNSHKKLTSPTNEIVAIITLKKNIMPFLETYKNYFIEIGGTDNHGLLLSLLENYEKLTRNNPIMTDLVLKDASAISTKINEIFQKCIFLADIVDCYDDFVISMINMTNMDDLRYPGKPLCGSPKKNQKHRGI